MWRGRLGVVTLLAIAGCARPPTVRGPRGTLEAYTSALVRDDSRAAFALLAAEERRRVTEPSFAAAWRATVEERRAQAVALAQAVAERRWTESARVLVPDGRATAEVLDADGWRLATPRAIEPGPATPEEALRRFAHALEQRNLDAALRLLADPLRSLVEHELEDRLAHLKKALGQPLVIDGDQARLLYEPRLRVDLRREHGIWRVSDFN